MEGVWGSNNNSRKTFLFYRSSWSYWQKKRFIIRCKDFRLLSVSISPKQTPLQRSHDEMFSWGKNHIASFKSSKPLCKKWHDILSQPILKPCIFSSFTEKGLIQFVFVCTCGVGEEVREPNHKIKWNPSVHFQITWTTHGLYNQSQAEIIFCNLYWS